ncbi:hypothetical protein [Burkholderia sp. THE68]|uniref:hypothetical protein n=1 Tax=Burkholderia sp. THE68 TaxID=758782 RepID=UPI001389FAE0|nr:hypothetical protein [Burkholderia sp. THE68]
MKILSTEFMASSLLKRLLDVRVRMVVASRKLPSVWELLDCLRLGPSIGLRKNTVNALYFPGAITLGYASGAALPAGEVKLADVGVIWSRAYARVTIVPVIGVRVDDLWSSGECKKKNRCLVKGIGSSLALIG